MRDLNEKMVSDFYNEYSEDIRVKRDQAHMIEFYSTMQYIERYLKSGDKVLEIGCGTGIYSLNISKKGIDTTAVDISDRNLETLRSRITKEMPIQSAKMNAINLSSLADESYNITLLLGPLYHLLAEQDIEAAINEAKRVTKIDGYIFISFLSKDYIIMRNCEEIFNNIYDSMDEKLENYNEPNGIFNYMSITDIVKLTNRFNLKKLHMLSTDGIAQFIGDQINNLSDKGYSYFIKHHIKNCERVELLGYSPHILYISKKSM